MRIFTDVQDGYLGNVNFLITKRQQDVNQINSIGQNLLHVVKTDDSDMIKYLVNKGINPTVRDEKGQTCLHVHSNFVRAFVNIIVPVIEKFKNNLPTSSNMEELPFIKNLSNKTKVDNYFITACEIIEKNISQLVTHKNKLNYSTVSPYGPDEDESFQARFDVMADIFQNKKTFTNIEKIAYDKNHPIFKSVVNKPNLYKKLLCILLLHAAETDNEYLLLQLICLGKEIKNFINTTDKEGNTALHIAVLNSQVDNCKFLMKYGANPNFKNNIGQTALHIAKTKDTEIIEALIHFHADISIKDSKNKTCFEVNGNSKERSIEFINAKLKSLQFSIANIGNLDNDYNPITKIHLALSLCFLKNVVKHYGKKQGNIFEISNVKTETLAQAYQYLAGAADTDAESIQYLEKVPSKSCSYQETQYLLFYKTYIDKKSDFYKDLNSRVGDVYRAARYLVAAGNKQPGIKRFLDENKLAFPDVCNKVSINNFAELLVFLELSAIHENSPYYGDAQYKLHTYYYKKSRQNKTDFTFSEDKQILYHLNNARVAGNYAALATNENQIINELPVFQKNDDQLQRLTDEMLIAKICGINSLNTKFSLFEIYFYSKRYYQTYLGVTERFNDIKTAFMYLYQAWLIDAEATEYFSNFNLPLAVDTNGQLDKEMLDALVYDALLTEMMGKPCYLPEKYYHTQYAEKFVKENKYKELYRITPTYFLRNFIKEAEEQISLLLSSSSQIYEGISSSLAKYIIKNMESWRKEKGIIRLCKMKNDNYKINISELDFNNNVNTIVYFKDTDGYEIARISIKNGCLTYQGHGFNTDIKIKNTLNLSEIYINDKAAKISLSHAETSLEKINADVEALIFNKDMNFDKAILIESTHALKINGSAKITAKNQLQISAKSASIRGKLSADKEITLIADLNLHLSESAAIDTKKSLNLYAYDLYAQDVSINVGENYINSVSKKVVLLGKTTITVKGKIVAKGNTLLAADSTQMTATKTAELYFENEMEFEKSTRCRAAKLNIKTKKLENNGHISANKVVINAKATKNHVFGSIETKSLLEISGDELFNGGQIDFGKSGTFSLNKYYVHGSTGLENLKNIAKEIKKLFYYHRVDSIDKIKQYMDIPVIKGDQLNIVSGIILDVFSIYELNKLTTASIVYASGVNLYAKITRQHSHVLNFDNSIEIPNLKRFAMMFKECGDNYIDGKNVLPEATGQILKNMFFYIIGQVPLFGKYINQGFSALCLLRNSPRIINKLLSLRNIKNLTLSQCIPLLLEFKYAADSIQSTTESLINLKTLALSSTGTSLNQLFSNENLKSMFLNNVVAPISSDTSLSIFDYSSNVSLSFQKSSSSVIAFHNHAASFNYNQTDSAVYGYYHEYVWANRLAKFGVDITLKGYANVNTVYFDVGKLNLYYDIDAQNSYIYAKKANINANLSLANSRVTINALNVAAGKNINFDQSLIHVNESILNEDVNFVETNSSDTTNTLINKGKFSTSNGQLTTENIFIGQKAELNMTNAKMTAHNVNLQGMLKLFQSQAILSENLVSGHESKLNLEQSLYEAQNTELAGSGEIKSSKLNSKDQLVMTGNVQANESDIDYKNLSSGCKSSLTTNKSLLHGEKTHLEGKNNFVNTEIYSKENIILNKNSDSKMDHALLNTKQFDAQGSEELNSSNLQAEDAKFSGENKIGNSCVNVSNNIEFTNKSQSKIVDSLLKSKKEIALNGASKITSSSIDAENEKLSGSGEISKSSLNASNEIKFADNSHHIINESSLKSKTTSFNGTTAITESSLEVEEKIILENGNHTTIDGSHIISPIIEDQEGSESKFYQDLIESNIMDIKAKSTISDSHLKITEQFSAGHNSHLNLNNDLLESGKVNLNGVSELVDTEIDATNSINVTNSVAAKGTNLFDALIIAFSETAIIDGKSTLVLNGKTSIANSAINVSNLFLADNSFDSDAVMALLSESNVFSRIHSDESIHIQTNQAVNINKEITHHRAIELTAKSIDVNHQIDLDKAFYAKATAGNVTVNNNITSGDTLGLVSSDGKLTVNGAKLCSQNGITLAAKSDVTLNAKSHFEYTERTLIALNGYSIKFKIPILVVDSVSIISAHGDNVIISEMGGITGHAVHIESGKSNYLTAHGVINLDAIKTRQPYSSIFVIDPLGINLGGFQFLSDKISPQYRSSVLAGENNVVNADSMKLQSSTLIGAQAVAIHTRKDVENLDSTIASGVYTEMIIGGNLKNIAREDVYQDQYGTRKKWTQSKIIGGSGEGHDGVGLFISTEGKIDNDSIIMSGGDAILWGKKGIDSYARENFYKSGEKESSGTLGFSHKKTSTWDTEYIVPIICSANGRAILKSNDGDVNLTATQLLSRFGSDIYGKNIKLYDIVPVHETTTEKSQYWGASRDKTREHNESSVPTIIANFDPGVTRLHAVNDIDSRGTIEDAPGSLEFEAENIYLKSTILNNYIQNEHQGFSVSVMGLKIAGSEPVSWGNPLDHNPALSHARDLSQSETPFDIGVNGVSTAISSSNVYYAFSDALQSDNLINFFAGQLGIDAMLKPEVSLTVTKSRTRLDYQTPATGGIYTDNLTMKAKNKISIGGVPIEVSNDMSAEADSIEFSGVELHSTQTSSQISATLSADEKGYNASLSGNRNKSENTTNVMQTTHVGNNLLFKARTVTLDHSEMKAKNLDPNTNIDTLNIKTRTDKSESSTVSGSISTKGNVAYANDTKSSASINQNSSMIFENGLTGKEDIKHINLTSATLTDSNKFAPGVVTESKVDTYNETKHQGASFSLQEAKQCYNNFTRPSTPAELNTLKKVTAEKNMDKAIKKVDTALLLADKVYEDDSGAKDLSGTHIHVGDSYEDKETGTKVVTYYDDVDKKAYISFMGSNNSTTWKTDNIDIFMGKIMRSADKPEFNDYIETEKEKYEKDGYEIFLTGHSRGAAQASVVSDKYDLPAIVFENSGMNSGLNLDMSKVVSFQSTPNPINSAGIISGRTFDSGTVINLPHSDKDQMLGLAAVLVNQSLPVMNAVSFPGLTLFSHKLNPVKEREISWENDVKAKSRN